jgi:diguanylate cyclase (GGDEF)-like protein
MNPSPRSEADRVRALRRYKILDTLPEQVFDDLTMLAAHICDAPIALISLIDGERQWFKSAVGLDVPQTPRSQAFCAHAIRDADAVMVVPDACSDPRFADNPLVTAAPGIRFYAGAPLVTHDRYALGTICVIDRKPRNLSAQQRQALQALSRQVVSQLDLRLQKVLLEEKNRRFYALATNDSLTGLFNHRAFHHELTRLFASSARHGRPLSLILIDIDQFKPYNEEFGHPAGDEVLKRFAAQLKALAREMDVAARYGGEEFALILPESDGLSAIGAAERFRRALSDTAWPHRAISASFGIATFSWATMDHNHLIREAETALRHAKAQGRDRATHFHDLMSAADAA